MVKIYKKWQGEEIENSRAVFYVVWRILELFYKKIESATYSVVPI